MSPADSFQGFDPPLGSAGFRVWLVRMAERPYGMPAPWPLLTLLGQTPCGHRSTAGPQAQRHSPYPQFTEKGDRSVSAEKWWRSRAPASWLLPRCTRPGSRPFQLGRTLSLQAGYRARCQPRRAARKPQWFWKTKHAPLGLRKGNFHSSTPTSEQSWKHLSATWVLPASLG